jgi:regulator of sigma E protease
MQIIVAILVFSFIIFFHELGHFLLARANDVKVNEFAIGMGPKLLAWTKGETTYCLKLLPFGGSCSMEGEDEESSDERAFNKKNNWQKFLIVFAGPFFNFLLAFILAVILLIAAGYNPAVVEDVIDGYPAQEAGIEAGDEIIRMGGYNVHFYNEIGIYSLFHQNESFDVTYIRDGQKYTTTVTPKLYEETGRYLIGVSGNTIVRRTGFFSTIAYGFYEIKYQIYVVLNSLKMLFTGGLSINDLSGPVGIVKSMGDTYNQAAQISVISVILTMMNYAVLLSANLGVMNLLPIPALDGGRILIYIIEGITRRKIPENVEGAINLAGFVLLMLLMVFVMGNDIKKIIAP